LKGGWLRKNEFIEIVVFLAACAAASDPSIVGDIGLLSPFFPHSKGGSLIRLDNSIDAQSDFSS
jgi:hypothetical protein